ncbi:unnamed protein product [Phaeothamnion confervicola]
MRRRELGTALFFLSLCPESEALIKSISLPFTRFRGNAKCLGAGKFLVFPEEKSASITGVTAGGDTAALQLGRFEPVASSSSYGPHVKVKGSALNLTGVLYLLSGSAWAIALFPLMVLAYLYSMAFDRHRRRFADWVVHLWCKVAVGTLGFRPKVFNPENLPAAEEAVMYVPNHCSFADILALSGFLPRPFKYVSKVEILRIPLIGWAMVMAKHVAIRRRDRTSEIKTFKDAVASLKAGNSLVTFAEGTRSRDGRLRAFKRGPFKMARKGGVRIVPVTLVNTHRMMPTDCLMPLLVPKDVEIHVHPPIDTAGRGEDELLELTRAAVVSALPPDQTPARKQPSRGAGVVDAAAAAAGIARAEADAGAVAAAESALGVVEAAVLPPVMMIAAEDAAAA